MKLKKNTTTNTINSTNFDFSIFYIEITLHSWIMFGEMNLLFSQI